MLTDPYRFTVTVTADREASVSFEDPAAALRLYQRGLLATLHEGLQVESVQLVCQGRPLGVPFPFPQDSNRSVPQS